MRASNAEAKSRLHCSGSLFPYCLALKSSCPQVGGLGHRAAFMQQRLHRRTNQTAASTATCMTMYVRLVGRRTVNRPHFGPGGVKHKCQSIIGRRYYSIYCKHSQCHKVPCVSYASCCLCLLQAYTLSVSAATTHKSAVLKGPRSVAAHSSPTAHQAAAQDPANAAS